jgi:hypothetical protein
MAGVAGPMLRRRRADGVRFLVGLMVGSTAAGLLLSLIIYLFGEIGLHALPAGWRLWLVFCACVGFGLADLLNRTPHIWRQVPQEFIHQLSPGLRGLTWGFDLGLLVTTQKAVSLGWIAIAATALMRPTVAPVLLITMAVVSSLSVAFLSMDTHLFVGRHGSKEDRTWLRGVRALSGTTIMTMAAVTLTQAL